MKTEIMLRKYVILLTRYCGNLLSTAIFVEILFISLKNTTNQKQTIKNYAS
ncbi:hypothetical protein Cal7507_5134 [Calothrix sp. PCC 7507]|nr:hypothetical protein Cal7507_5134 [Calothrix sp. PCC 7507]